MFYATGKSGLIGRNLSATVSPLAVDLSDYRSWLGKTRVTEFDSVLHLAGVVGSRAVEHNLQESFRINVEGAIALAKESLDRNVKKFIYVSSSHVYAKSSEKLSEYSELEPISNYAEQKLTAEEGIRELFSGYEDRLLICRVFSVIDWESSEGSLGHKIRTLTESGVTENLQYVDDMRDFLTPRQVAAILEIMLNLPTVNGVLNICSGEGTSIREIAACLLTYQGISIDSTRYIPGFSETPYIVGNNEKLQETLRAIPETAKNFRKFDFNYRRP